MFPLNNFAIKIQDWKEGRVKSKTVKISNPIIVDFPATNHTGPANCLSVPFFRNIVEA